MFEMQIYRKRKEGRETYLCVHSPVVSVARAEPVHNHQAGTPTWCHT